MTLPMKICTISNCGNETQDIIYLIGDIFSEVVVGTATPPAVRIGGLLSMVGDWNKAFGIPFLQLSNVVAGATFDLALGFPAPPSSLILGASACIGSTDACTTRDTDAKNFIAGGAYLGLDTAVPENNFFLGMVSAFTIEHILRVAAVIEPSLEVNLINELPQSVLNSGISPPDANADACTSTGNSTAQALGEEPLNLDCYAYVALSPFTTNEIASIGLTIPRGIGFAGKLNLFDFFEVQVEAQIDVIETTNPSFYLFAQLDKIVLGNVLEIGGSISDSTKRVEGNAVFLVDYKTADPENGDLVSLLVDIQGALGIPLLKTYGEVDISVNNEGVSYQGELFILGGALHQIVVAKWDWDFTFFYLELGDLVFSPGVLELDQLILDVQIEGGFTFLFDIEITVLSFSEYGATVQIEERNNGADLWVYFKLYAEMQLVDCKIEGDATLDLAVITNTEFGSFDVTCEPGGALDALVGFVNDAIDFLESGFNTAIAAVEVAINAIGNFLLDIFSQLDFLADAWSDFEDSVEALLSGDFAGAASALKEGFETAIDPENWEEAGEAILETLEDTGLAINDALGLSSNEVTKTRERLSEEDQWNCNYIRTKTVTQRCWRICGFGSCCCRTCDSDTDYSEKYHNSTCVAEKKDLLEKVRAKAETAGTYGDGTTSTRDGNAAILNENRGAFPTPEIDDIAGTVTYNKDGNVASILKATITGKTKTLDNDMSDGYSSGMTSFSTTEVDLDFSSSNRRHLQTGEGPEASQRFLNSVISAFEVAEGAVNETVNKDMTGLDRRIKQFGNDPLEPLEIAFDAIDETIDVNCSALGDANSRKPKIAKYDPDCGSTLYLTSSQAMAFRRTGESFEVPAVYECGTLKVTRKYTVRDKCEQDDMDTQTIYMKPEAPVFTSVPNQEPETTYSTSVESLDPDAQGGNWPQATSVCGYPVEIDSSDAVPEEVEGQCGLWTVSRFWDALLVLGQAVDDYCSANGNPDSPAAQAIQKFNMKDDEAPRYIEDVAEEVRIPFFNNYNSTRLNAPLIKDIATNLEAFQWGLHVREEMLTSRDYGFEFSPTNPQNEAQCREKGIAHFYREFTASDKCGNSKTFTQKVIIEHPPESLTATIPLGDGTYSLSPGVEQSLDACIPGKDVTVGDKSFAADFDFSVKSNVCAEGQAWDENGCRLETNVPSSVVEVLSVKPEFVTFPGDATVLTNQSISTDTLGEPTGTAFCSTPFEIVHADDAAVLLECGVWEIKRRWTIRPVYDGCTVVTDPRLATERVQVIIVLDVFPPEFTFLPESQVDVPFLGDYGPGNLSVDFPQVEDQVYHPTLVEHATLHNTMDNFLFVSYPTTLFYDDEVQFMQSSDEVCASGSLADVTRTWTTYDRCGTTSKWTQKIHIVEPSEPLFADASGFQLASPEGSIQLRNSDMSQDVMSKGEDFGMWDSTVYCSTENCEEAHPSLVLDSCPKHKLEASYLPDGTILYREEEGGKKCNAFFNGKDKKTPIEESYSVDFSAASAAIKSMSSMVADGPSDLLTGPQTINCTSPETSTCFNVVMSSIDPIHAHADPATGTLSLIGLHRVYNPFLVNMGEWFFNSVEYETPPDVRVEAEGFVFVNVVDNVVMTAFEDDRQFKVERPWDNEADFVCSPDLDTAQSMPSLGNFDFTPSSSRTRRLQESSSPTTAPSSNPSSAHTSSDAPSNAPTSKPSSFPSASPSALPSLSPSTGPSSFPSTSPSAFPSLLPSAGPSDVPSIAPSSAPTSKPSTFPSVSPSALPSHSPSAAPSAIPSNAPTSNPPLTYGLRRVTTGSLAQDPATHLLVNLWPIADVNLNGHPTLTMEDAYKCAGLRYRFSKHHEQYFTTTGTYVISTEMSSFEIWDYQWEGGQLMTLGASVDWRWAHMHQGLYLPDESSFCSGGRKTRQLEGAGTDEKEEQPNLPV